MADLANAAFHHLFAQTGGDFMPSVSGPQDGAFSSIVPFSPHYLMGEIASAAAVLGAIMQIIPSIGALMAVGWYCIMFYEWVTRFRARRKIESAAEKARAVVVGEAENVAQKLKDDTTL